MVAIPKIPAFIFEEFRKQLKSFFEKTYGKQVDYVDSYYTGWYRNDIASELGWTKDLWSKMTRSEMKNSHMKKNLKNF